MIIHYICNYDDYLVNRNLATQPSGNTKIAYIKYALKQAGFNVHIYSTAECKGGKFYCFPFKKKNIDDKETDIFPLVFSRSNIVLKALSRILKNIQILIYIIFFIKSEDKVLVYHSLRNRSIINFVLLFKHINLYFEVEEIYHAVYHSSHKKISSEIEYLHKCKGYILVNDIMREKCNFNQVYVSCYGVYLSRTKQIPCSSDGFIHIVYAGVIEKLASDAFLAVDLAKFLPSNYKIHILGYGVHKDIQSLCNYIESEAHSHTCSVSYEGCLLGKEYYDFLSKCQIGLCTRVLEDDLSDYTFPSKVMVYLSNNVIPVCTPISCVQKSKVSDLIVFSPDNSPKSIANKILEIDLSMAKNCSQTLSYLHKDFVSNLKKVFSYENTSNKY